MECRVFYISVLSVGDSLFKMAPQHSGAVLLPIPNCKKAMMCLLEKMCVLAELYSSMTDRAVDHEFIGNGPPMSIK